MSQVDQDNQDEKPLDPVMEGVRRKMIKLQLISGGIMAMMFMAVLVAIAYKLTRSDGTPSVAAQSTPFLVPSDQPLALTASLPAGFKIVSTSLSGNQILIYGETAAAERKALVLDLSVGRIIADVTLAEH